MTRHPARRFALVAALAAAASLVSYGSAAAQEHHDDAGSGLLAGDRVRLDVRAGIAIPTADMRNYVDEGPVLGAGVSYRLGERLSIRGDWTVALMRAANRRPFRDRGADVPPDGSETDLHHLTGGVQMELSEPGEADIEVRVHAGLGVTFLSTEETQFAEGGDFTQFTLDGGLELAVPLSEDVRFIGRGDLFVLPFRAGAPEHLLKEVTLPFTGGLAVRL